MTTLLPTPSPIPGITWRPPRKGDAAAIAALQDACFEVDGGHREVEAEILQRWTLDTHNIDTDALVAVDAADEVVATTWSVVPKGATTRLRAFSHNYVHPAWRTDEMLEFVLGWWEIRSVQRFSAESAELEQWLCRDVYDWQSDEIEFLASHGYQPVRYFDELLRNLETAIDEHPLPEGLSVRTLNEVTIEDLRLVHNEAFADHWGSQPFTEASWAMFDNEFLLRDASFLVSNTDGPVAYLISSAYPHDFEDRGHSEAWIEALGTVRSHRKRGVASALVAMAVDEFADMGMQFAVIGVDSESPTGANHLYESLGFAPDRRSIAYNKQVFPTESEAASG